MSDLAKQLIEKEKRERTGKLDLGRCGLTDLEKQVPELFELEWLEALTLCNEWYDLEKKKWIESPNKGARNKIAKIPPTIPKLHQLRVLRIGGGFGDNWQISGIPSLKMLAGLRTLDLGGNQISDYSFLEKLTGLTSLYLSNNQISDTRSLEKLTGLRTLDLGGNQISDYSFFEKFTGLTSLYLRYNKINDLHFLEKLKGLTSLDLRYNKIRNIRSLEKLKVLRTLDLSGNQIRNIRSLERLTGLTSLYLRYNKISDIRSLEKLMGLTSLDLSSNQISDTRSLEKLTGLTSLDLSYNQISDISFLEKLTGLTSLDLRNNQVSDIRFLEKLTGLTLLDLRSNQISDITPLLPLIGKGVSVTMGEFGSGIRLYENPLTVPPPEVVKEGNEAVLRYFEELERSGSYRIMESRLLIVGQGGAGKTSLKRKLKNVDEAMPEKGDTTRGIDIMPLLLKTKDGEDFTLHVWDFGGQNIQHYAHQFFLTGSSLYVLVHNQREQNTNFQYWLNIIEMLGAASPVIILQNEVAGHCEPLDNAATIRDRFKNVVEPFHQVDLWNAATDARFEPLKEAIAAIASNPDLLPHFGTTRPGSFVKVREKLVPLALEHQFISWGKFIELCAIEGVTNPELVADYGNIFTVLGTFLHFPNDLELCKFIFLRPKWIIDALFKLLYHDIVVNQKKGEFNEMDTLKIWQGDEYEQMHGKLIRLMENFELCYPVTDRPTDRRFIVPQRLASAGSSFPWGEEDVVRVIYRYKFMPRGIITRLTCRMHRLIEDAHVWSDAVIFHKAGTKNRIFVRERFAEDEIWIESAGPKRSDLLNKVVETIDAIHEESKFANMRREKLIPCDCNQCKRSDQPHYFDYDDLVKSLAEGETREKCKASRERIEIKELLARVFENGDNAPAYIETLKLMMEQGIGRMEFRQEKMLANDAATHGKLDDLDGKIQAVYDALIKDIDNHKGSFFNEGSDEEKQFYDKIDALISKHHVKEVPKNWHDLPPKSKLKIALKIPLLEFVGIDIRHEWEMDTSNAKRPKTWAEFKRWFLYPEKDQ